MKHPKRKQSHPRFWFSLIEYRPRPATHEDAISLGVAVEAAVGNLWLVGIYVRAGLTAGEVERLDGVGRDLLKSPPKTIERAVESVLFSAEAPPQRPGDALTELALRQGWSFHFSEPKLFHPTPGYRSQRQAVENAAVTLYGKHIKTAPPVRRLVNHSPAPVAPPWANQPKLWEVHVGAGACEDAADFWKQ